MGVKWLREWTLRRHVLNTWQGREKVDPEKEKEKPIGRVF